MEESRLDVPDSETAGQSPEPEDTSDRSSATEGRVATKNLRIFWGRAADTGSMTL